ncbi:MAG: hypothetical protein SV377_06375, partial [Halobacteria archaeon]|nr:hypothetical protein [Halobacteria archaeon]
MKKNDSLDGLADKIMGETGTLGKDYRNKWLKDLPRTQWPFYIDESVVDLTKDGYDIKSVGISLGNIGVETGLFYKQGLAALGGPYSDLPDVLSDVPGDKIGEVMKHLNHLVLSVFESNGGIEDFGRTVEMIVNDALASQDSDFTPVRLPRGEVSAADVMLQLFSDPSVRQRIDLLSSRLEEMVEKGVSGVVDKPKMTVRLWPHQVEALRAWQGNGCRGYVEMPEKSGKSVLAVASIAHHYGSLHPGDTELVDEKYRGESEETEVLVVLDEKSVVDEWKRVLSEFAGIPPERINKGGRNRISFDWGKIHFETITEVAGIRTRHYDLVICDNIERYPEGRWDKFIKGLDTHVLALSRPDERIREKLGSDLEKVFTYTEEDALEDGISNAFDWHIRYTGFEGETEELKSITSQCENLFRNYSSQNVSFQNYGEVRSFSNTKQGLILKRNDEDLKNLSTAVLARRAKLYYQTPDLDTVVEMIERGMEGSENENTGKKHLVLVDAVEQAKEIEKRLKKVVENGNGGAIQVPIPVMSLHDKESREGVLDEFEEADKAVLVATQKMVFGDRPLPRADVAVSVSPTRMDGPLLRQLSRILRGGQTSGKLYQVIGLPTEDETLVPSEDGIRVLDEAVRMVELGDDIAVRVTPKLETSTGEVERTLAELEKAGREVKVGAKDEADLSPVMRELLDRIESAQGSALVDWTSELEEEKEEDESDEETPEGPEAKEDTEEEVGEDVRRA